MEAGKSTLINIILGNLTNYVGNIVKPKDLKISYVGQDISGLKGSLKEYILKEDIDEYIFKSTLARFNRIYAFVTQVCRLFDKDIHKFSAYAKFLDLQLPKGGNEVINVDDKVLLEYYRLEKDFEGSIELEPTEEGFKPITGEAGRREKKKDPLTIIIDKINEKYGTTFTEMDKVLLQIENDYATQDKWKSYAHNNDYKTFMLLFAKDFPEMAASRFEQNESFFVKMFSDPDMMKQVMDTIGGVLYERLRKGIHYDTTESAPVLMVAEDEATYNTK